MSLRPALGEGDKARDFELPDLKGNLNTLSEHKGRVVFLNFFATWCPPCRDEMPSIQRLNDELYFKNFIVITISVDEASAAYVSRFMDEHGYSFKVLHDRSGKVARVYGARSIPNTFIIDKQGKIVHHIIGSRDWSDEAVIQEFKRLIDE
jgi:peroxiredoxin